MSCLGIIRIKYLRNDYLNNVLYYLIRYYLATVTRYFT